MALNYSEQRDIGPWSDLAMARYFLNRLVEYPIVNDWMESSFQSEPNQLASWLIRQGLGPLSYAMIGSSWPELSELLQADTYSAMAESDVHQLAILEMGELFSRLDIPVVWLKGTALAYLVYPESWQRVMSDVDAWVLSDSMKRAVFGLHEMGYQVQQLNEQRPFSLQEMFFGEVQLTHTHRHWGMVELHWGPLAGWWIIHSTQVDNESMWRRKQPLPGTSGGYQLEINDMVLQVAVHMAVSHHFCEGALRNIIDIARLGMYQGVDWALVAERAKRWRVGTAVYTVLDQLDQLIGVDDVDEALQILKPSAFRRRLIRRFVTPESVLAGRDLRNGTQRFLLLLLLVDRPRDMVKLIWRTLWPEPAWLEARYGGNVGHWRHLWRVVRYREV